MPDALNVLPAALAGLLGRASVPARLLREPAPDAGALDLAAAAAGTMNFLNALEMMGFGGVWLSSESLRDGVVKVALGFAETDALVGWVYVGTPGADRPRPEREAPGGIPGFGGGVRCSSDIRLRRGVPKPCGNAECVETPSPRPSPKGRGGLRRSAAGEAWYDG